MVRSFFVSSLAVMVTAAEILLLLVVELLASMLIYIYLNLYHVTLFGNLVRDARYVLDALVGQMEYWLPVSANSAYATLIGELGPKSLLLLLIGLVTAMIIRFLVRSVARAFGKMAPGSSRSKANLKRF
jgi:hypothetical protein